MTAKPTPYDLNLPFGIGSTIAGKYRVDKVLGAGGMGYVFAGMHVALGQKVAIKVLKPTAHNPEFVARFEREARAAARLRSEHIARVLDVGEVEGGLPYMVMEYLRGQDLAQILKEKGPLPIADAVDYMLQACEALAEAHRAGIVHRDLKPANLFLTTGMDGSPLIKVLDFGISKVASAGGELVKELTESQTVIGSPHYMSPEQLKSARTVDARTDIWSIGSVLYKLLTGAPAFDAESQAELCVEILMSDPEPMSKKRPELPPELDAIVARCLEKSPAQRWQSMGELAAALTPLAPPRSQSSAERISRMMGSIHDVHGSEPPRASGEAFEAVSSTMPLNSIPVEQGTMLTTSVSQKAAEPTGSLVVPVTRIGPKLIVAGGAVALLIGCGLAYALASSKPAEVAKPAPNESVEKAAAAVPPPAPIEVATAEPEAQASSAAPPVVSAHNAQEHAPAAKPAAPRVTAATAKPATSAKPGLVDFGGRK